MVEIRKERLPFSDGYMYRCIRCNTKWYDKDKAYKCCIINTPTSKID